MSKKTKKKFADRPTAKLDPEQLKKLAAKRERESAERVKKHLDYLVYEELLPGLNIEMHHLTSRERLPSIVEALLRKTYWDFSHREAGSKYSTPDIQAQSDEFIQAFYKSDKAAKTALLYGALKGIDVLNIGKKDFAVSNDEDNYYGFKSVVKSTGIEFINESTGKKANKLFIRQWLLDDSELTEKKLQLKDVEKEIIKTQAKDVRKRGFSIEGFLASEDGRSEELKALQNKRLQLKSFIERADWRERHVEMGDPNEIRYMESFLESSGISDKMAQRLREMIRGNDHGTRQLKLIDADDVEAMYEFLQEMIQFNKDKIRDNPGDKKEYYQMRQRYYSRAMMKHKEGIARIVAKYGQTKAFKSTMQRGFRIWDEREKY